MKKSLLFILPLALGIIAGQSQLVHAEGNLPQSYTDSTDPAKVFPKDKVDNMIQDAEQKPVLPDPGLPEHSRQKRNAGNQYPRRAGVILVTPDAYKGIPTGHAAIMRNTNSVVEALSDGVKIGHNNWDNSSASGKNRVYAVDVNATSNYQEGVVAEYCAAYKGKPYNWNFFNMDTRDSFYCSQLIRAGFLDSYKLDLNTSEFDAPFGKVMHPIEFVNSDKTTLIYRRG